MRESVRRGMGDMGNMGPQRDMGEELGRKGGRDDDDDDRHPTYPPQCTQALNTSRGNYSHIFQRHLLISDSRQQVELSILVCNGDLFGGFQL